MNDRDIEDTRQPPDEPEAVFCEECGEEMDCDDNERSGICTNLWCPNKHSGTAMDMAVRIVELEEENHILKARNNYLELAMERKWNATKK